MKLKINSSKKIYILLFLVFLSLAWSLIKPSNDRDWELDQKVLPFYEKNENFITVYNIRNFTYITTQDYLIDYYNETFNLDELSSVYFIVEPFSEWEGAAHTFVSFGFANENYLAISIEIRKEIKESFSAAKGLFKKYEVMYVIGDERDLIKLRTNYRNDSVYLYPVNTTDEKMRAMLFEMLDRTNKLRETPEFYNTLTNTCTTNLVRHINNISPRRIPFSLKVLAPGYSDRLAYDLGLIKTNMSFEDTREYYRINDKALIFADDPDFSRKIRNLS
jgi:hypothetical protein